MTSLLELRGLRSAPELDGAQRDQLMLELETQLAGCAWFTIGIMAPSAAGAMAAEAAVTPPKDRRHPRSTCWQSKAGAR